jgi:hypothetical protein
MTTWSIPTLSSPSWRETACGAKGDFHTLHCISGSSPVAGADRAVCFDGWSAKPRSGLWQVAQAVELSTDRRVSKIASYRPQSSQAWGSSGPPRTDSSRSPGRQPQATGTWPTCSAGTVSSRSGGSVN